MASFYNVQMLSALGTVQEQNTVDNMPLNLVIYNSKTHPSVYHVPVTMYSFENHFQDCKLEMWLYTIKQPYDVQNYSKSFLLLLQGSFMSIQMIP